MLWEYEAIRSALAHDQLGEAKSAALVLASNHDAKQKLADEARVISQSDSLDAARNVFVAMSETAVDLVAHRFAGCRRARKSKTRSWACGT